MQRCFPEVELADDYGLLAVSESIDTELLIEAYSSGIFPWPIQGYPGIPWFAPPQRALLFVDTARIPKSLRKFSRQSSYTIRCNTDFEAVIRACAEPRAIQRETWITEAIISAYSELHRLGFAHSIECYEGEQLIGGLYGVSLGAMFAGESMFYRKPNASKLCLYWLLTYLRESGAAWLDCQQMTPVARSFGAQIVKRHQFQKLLKTALLKEPIYFSDAGSTVK
jgi:leucyl/phenylalanyl-tRNA--protein transferase